MFDHHYTWVDTTVQNYEINEIPGLQLIKQKVSSVDTLKKAKVGTVMHLNPCSRYPPLYKGTSIVSVDSSGSNTGKHALSFMIANAVAVSSVGKFTLIVHMAGQVVSC